MANRNFSEIFTTRIDAAAPLVNGAVYTGEQFFMRVPNVAGNWVDSKGQIVQPGTALNAIGIVGTNAPADVSAFTEAEFALIEIVGIPETTGVPAHLANTDLHLPTVKNPLEFVRRNAADDGWETTPITISSANTVSGLGAPTQPNPATLSVTQAGYYYQQIDAPAGENDVWGASIAGTPATWPAQADGKSYDERSGVPQDFPSASADYAVPKSQSISNLDEWALTKSDHEVTKLDTQALEVSPNIVNRLANGGTHTRSVEMVAGDILSVSVHPGESSTVTGVGLITNISTTDILFKSYLLESVSPDIWKVYSSGEIKKNIAITPKFLAESADSGAATTAGLTFLDVATQLPVATENQTIYFQEDGFGFLAGQSARANKDTAGNIPADWSLYINDSSEVKPPLPREAITASGNKFTPKPNYYTWLSPSGTAAGSTIQLPDVSVFDAANEVRGIIHNISGEVLKIAQFPGQIAIALPLTISHQSALHWRQTGPGYITGYVAGVPSATEEDRISYRKTVSMYFQNSWIARPFTGNPHADLYQNGTAHYVASRDMVLDLLAVYQASEGGGLTIGLQWQIYTGAYWQEPEMDGNNSDNTPQGGNHRRTDHVRVYLKAGEYIRLRTYLSNGGNNSYPGNRSVRIDIQEVSDSKYVSVGDLKPAKPIRRYSADGAISDEDQTAIFETGAVNMTIATTTSNRKIDFYRTSAVDVVIVDSSGQQFKFKDPAPADINNVGITTTTNSTITINEPLTVATMTNDGASWNLLA